MVATGAVAPSSPLAQAVIQPLVTIRRRNGAGAFRGVVAGWVGLYQIDVRIRTGLAAGSVPIVVSQGGVAANMARFRCSDLVNSHRSGESSRGTSVENARHGHAHHNHDQAADDVVPEKRNAGE